LAGLERPSDASLTDAHTQISDSALILDYAALKSGAGMRLLDDWQMVRVTGDDRVSFMHGMCTADIKGLAKGTLTPALFVTEHAHVISDCFIYALESDALCLEVERERWPQVRLHLEKLLVADDVEMEELDSLAILELEGPKSAAIIASISGEAASRLAPWQCASMGDISIANLPRYGIPAFTLIGERTKLEDIQTGIREQNPGVRDLSAKALDIIRIENGLARVGVDTTDRTLALEARLERAISFSKGCYLGQETIERATARGALKRRLCALQIDGPLPTAGAPIMLAGKEIGRLSSVARSSQVGIIGLAMLHHSAWPLGTRVTIGTDGDCANATVVEPGTGSA
jgi:folate-binding protein YgfZ